MMNLTAIAVAAITQTCGGGPDLTPSVLVTYEPDSLDFIDLDTMVHAVEAAGYIVAGTHETHDYDWPNPNPPYNYGPNYAMTISGNGVYDEVPFVAEETGADGVVHFVWVEYPGMGCTVGWQTNECNIPNYGGYWSLAISSINLDPLCFEWNTLTERVEYVTAGWHVNNSGYDVANFGEPQLCPGDHDGDDLVGTPDLLIATAAGYTEPLLATLANWGNSCGGTALADPCCNNAWQCGRDLAKKCIEEHNCGNCPSGWPDCQAKKDDCGWDSNELADCQGGWDEYYEEVCVE